MAAMATPFNTASLYVGDLTPEVNEAHLYELFKAIGPVASVRVCRDMASKRSLGYAYVNFHNREDADRAIENINATLIEGRPCRISYSHRDPSLRKSGLGNIFINHLDKTVDQRALIEIFTKFGNIYSAKVVYDPTGVSKGYGYVQFDSQEAAAKAIAEFDGKPIPGKSSEALVVQYFRPRAERQEVAFTNLYVKNLPAEFTEDELRELFGKYGAITSVKLSTDGQGRCYGFVNFATSDAAHNAVSGLHDQKFRDAVLYVARAQKRTEREQALRLRREHHRNEQMRRFQGLNLYVKNLGAEIDEAALRAAFQAFGTITSAKVMRDEKTGASRGFGFVCFSTPEEAGKALQEMQGRQLSGKPLYVAMHQTREQRKPYLEQMFNARMPMQQGMFPAGPFPPMFYARAGMPPQQAQFPYPVGMFPAARFPRGSPVMRQQGGFMPQMQQQPQQQQQQRANQRGGRRDNRAPQQQGGVPQQQQQQRAMLKGNAANVRSNQPQDAAAAAAPAAQDVELTAERLAQASPEEASVMLGVRLLPKVQQFCDPLYASKVTGMLLQMDSSEVLFLLSEEASLREAVQEAMQVLTESNWKPEAA